MQCIHSDLHAHLVLVGQELDLRQLMWLVELEDQVLGIAAAPVGGRGCGAEYHHVTHVLGGLPSAAVGGALHELMCGMECLLRDAVRDRLR